MCRLFVTIIAVMPVLFAAGPDKLDLESVQLMPFWQELPAYGDPVTDHSRTLADVVTSVSFTKRKTLIGELEALGERPFGGELLLTSLKARSPGDLLVFLADHHDALKAQSHGQQQLVVRSIAEVIRSRFHGQDVAVPRSAQDALVYYRQQLAASMRDEVDRFLAIREIDNEHEFILRALQLIQTLQQSDPGSAVEMYRHARHLLELHSSMQKIRFEKEVMSDHELRETVVAMLCTERYAAIVAPLLLQVFDEATVVDVLAGDIWYENRTFHLYQHYLRVLVQTAQVEELTETMEGLQSIPASHEKAGIVPELKATIYAAFKDEVKLHSELAPSEHRRTACSR